MRFTGERVIPDRYELKPMLQEHLIRYTFATPYVQGADVIDLGCGCGYGSYMLATQGARSVVGVDIAPEAIDYARERYQAPNLTFHVGDVTALAYPDRQFSAAVCLEVFEHVQAYMALLKEAVRVLSPGGTLILSTPNKQVWSPGRAMPINPWHIREFEREEFGHALDSALSDVRYWGQTTTVPGIIPFILANLRVQSYYTRRRSPIARFVEWLHGAMMKVVMLPPHIIPGALDNDPNLIVPEEELAPEKRYYFVAVGRTASA
jgi:SAM-dependent methyltransferase